MTELLKIHPSDDMAVALVDLTAGVEVEVTGQKLQLLEDEPLLRYTQNSKLPQPRAGS